MKEKITEQEKKIERLSEDIKEEAEKAIMEKEEIEEKNEDLAKQLDDAKKLAEERLSQLKYLHADFDNYRKKFEKEKESIIMLANESLITELIVVLDDFENSIKLVEDKKNREGIELLHKKFFDILARHGLKKIEALGKKFDPNFHEALYKELSKHEEDMIIEEIQKGYALKSKVIRPAKVKISRGNKEDLKIGEKK